MAIIKEINELHISLKAFLILLLLIMPFWYLSIFLFKREFILSYEFHIPIILSFCLSICHLTTNLFITLLYDFRLSENKPIKNEQQDPILNIYIFTGIGSILWISIYMFLGFYYDWKLLSMIKILFFTSFMHIVLFLIIDLIDKKMIKYNNRKNK